MGEQEGHHAARTVLSTEGVPDPPPQRGAEGTGKHPRPLGTDTLQALILGTARNTQRWVARQSQGPGPGTRRKQAGVGWSCPLLEQVRPLEH